VDKKTRTVRYLSPSALQLADDSTEKGCLRKWFYAYVMGFKEPSTWQQAAGTEDHACVERYLITGERILRPRVAKGLHMLPPPGPQLLIEHDMVPTLYEGRDKCEACKGASDAEHTCKAVSGLHIAPLDAAGIKIAGRIDLMHDLCVNYGADGVEDTRDPEGTVEVFDHKFTKNLDYAIKGPDLARNIQMVAYGEYVFRTIPGAKFVRLSHGYYPTNGQARKSTVRVTRDPISRYWTEHVEPLARSIADAAKQENADNVKPNTKACKAYGRMCMHAEYCSAGMDKGLQAHVGGTAAQALLDALKKPKDPSNMALIPGKGLLAHISKPPADVAAAREAELAKLKAEEAAAKKSIIPEGFAELLASIEAFGKGMPQISGEAAKVYAAFKGYDYKATQGYGGSGDLGDVTITEVGQYQDLLAELTEAFGAPQTQATVNDSGGLLPDDVPVIESAPPPAPQANPMEQIQAEADKPKATRKPRTSKAAKVELPPEQPHQVTNNQVDAAVQVSPSDEAKPMIMDNVKVSPVLDTRVNLVADVLIEGPTTFEDLAPIIDSLTDEMAKRFNLDDCRMAPAKDASGKDHPLAFGKWKAVLTAAIRENTFPPGTYYIDAKGNEIYEEAVQAMRYVVRRTGGYYARGGR
jgi:hypothetical protein